MRWREMGAAAALLAAGAAQAAEQQLAILDPVVVTATRFLERYDDKPVNVTVITAGDMQRSAAKTVPDLLAEQAGIHIHDFFGNNAATTTVDLRGFGISGTQNTLVLIDGRRAADLDLSGVQWSALPLAAIERIEIVRGGGAVLYGDGATAGVINIITRSPLAQPTGAGTRVRAGSYGMKELNASANHAGERIGFNFTASNFESDGYRANNSNRQSNALADFRVLTGSGEVALKLGTDHQGIRLPGARQVQPSTGVNQLLTDRRGAQTPLDWSQRNGNRMNLDWRHDTGLGEFNLGLGWRDKEQISYFDFGGFPDFRIADLDVWSFSPRFRATPALPGGRHTLVFGLDWQRWDYRLRRSNAVANIGRPFNTVDARQETLGFYAQDSLAVSERLTLTAGLRSERLAIDADDRFDAAAPGGAFGSGAPSGLQRESEKAYELGARYALAAGAALIARTGRSYRFANVDEIYETSALFTNQFQFLRPQTARHHELGLELRRSSAWLRAALFRMDVRDEIHLDAYTTGIGNTNLPPSRRHGLELEGRWEPLPALALSGSYSHIDARFREGVLPGGAFTATNVVIAGRTVPLVPRHKLNIGAAWAFSEASRLSLTATYVAKQYMDNDQGNTLGTQIPSYVVADLKLSHREGPWTLSAAINNLFDRKYYNYAVRSQFVADRYNAYPLPERNFGVSVAYAFR
ncbi:MAG: TonB-dependent receptor [Burkholderiales bacterium]|nr:TonB-dependent receptor [Burkholderiales bacterium]